MWRLVALGMLAVPGGLLGQSYDLAVTGITPPPSPAVQVAGNFVISLSIPGGATGVTVTAVFTSVAPPAVTFNAAASSSGCAGNTSTGDPSTTVTCPATGVGSVTINVTPQTGGTLSVVAGVIGNEFDPDMTYNSATVTVNVSASSPTVTAISPKAGASAGMRSVTITGTNFQSGATVTVGGSAATNVTVVSATQITALTPSHTAGAASVTVTNPGGGSGTLSNGYTFMAATVFLDDPLVQYSTTVKAQHILDLRNAIAGLRSVASLSAPTWTYTVAAGVMVHATDVQEMRTQLDPALMALGYSTSAYTDPTLTPQVTLIKKVHIDDLRGRVKQVTN